MATRRAAVTTLLQCAVLAHPFSRGVLAFDLGGRQIERQPLVAAVRRLVDAMAYLGEPLSDADRARLDAAGRSDRPPRPPSPRSSASSIPRCLRRRSDQSRRAAFRSSAAPPPAQLVEHGWRAFLIKVRNEAGVTGALSVESPQARPVSAGRRVRRRAPQSVCPADVADRWLALRSTARSRWSRSSPVWRSNTASCCSTAAISGRREAQIGANLGAGTADIGFRNRTAVLFDIADRRAM